MKIVGVIPARYQSTRLPGKPLADICGKPMIWWVYQQAKKIERMKEVYVATDDARIKTVCELFEIPVVMTAVDNPTHLNRIYEFSQKVEADLYTIICGDEPLIKGEIIEKVIPNQLSTDKYIARALMREFTDPAEVVDPGNIKIAANSNGDCMYLSRSPIPFPYKTVLFKYRKIVGIECYNKAALEFFVSCPVGYLEKIEDIAILRFMENKIGMHFTLVNTNALSVDTEKDLEKVRMIIAEDLKKQKD
ncbi:3-deoxy-manno-octulosonate cytidylyltransferase [Desulfitobacterium hafniense]|uniref:3-deoxy-manno-octulosonate cytidylyltransferase n=1 Tax=Desulfitobacterium hafniense TaxID=49338 RepID=UPI00035EBEF4|nr:3-deoxy-manno-octulosonate cytidylyltransferase [Desulfitobacterium hafniense]